MPSNGDVVPFFLRDRRIKAVEDKFHREPTGTSLLSNELRAIDALPLEPRKSLNDTSLNGQRIYDLLKAFEIDGLVEALEEAGSLLWEQIFATPDFSQRPRVRQAISIATKFARTANAEVSHIASQKHKQTSPAEKVTSINAVPNAFAGPPRKSWMKTGAAVPPSPRRRSSLSTERGIYSDTTCHSFQSSTTPISFRLAQPGHQNRSHESIHVNQMPRYPSDTYNRGIYTPWPLHSTFHEPQYASSYPFQLPRDFSILKPLRATDWAQELRPQILNIPHGNTRNLNRQFLAFIIDIMLLKIPVDYQTTQNTQKAQAFPIDDPSIPSFHPALSNKAQKLLVSRKTEENEFTRITADIHRSLASLPGNSAKQQVASKPNMYHDHSSKMDAANTLSNMPKIDRRTELATPRLSVQQKPSLATTSIPPKQLGNNPFIIRGDMSFIRTFERESAT